MSLSLTQIRELDREILQEMDDRTLTQACQTNQWLRQICSDDFFWRERLQRRYGDEFLAMKSPQESYHQMYVRLAQLKYTPSQSVRSAAQGHLDELLLLERAGVGLNPKLIEIAAANGQLDVLKWALSKGLFQPQNIRFIMRRAANHGQLEVMKWLSQNFPGVELDPSLIEDAAVNGQLDVLKWALSKGLFQHQNIDIIMRRAANHGQLEVMKWLNQNFPGHLTRLTVGPVFSSGRPETLDWLLQMGYHVTHEEMHDAIQGDNVEAIDWLAQHGMPPNNGDAMAAVTMWRPVVLEYLYQQYGLLPHLNQEQINAIAANGHLDVLIWLERHGLGQPDARAARTIQQHIRQLQINPTTPPPAGQRHLLSPEEFQEMLENYRDILEWMAERGLY